MMTEQIVGSAPSLAGRAWRCWTADTPEDVAAAAFVRRYGAPPQHIIRRFRMLWLGPIPGSEV